MKRVSSSSSELNDVTEENGKLVYNVSKSRSIKLINWLNVFRTYLPIIWYIIVVILIGQILKTLIDIKFNFKTFIVTEMKLMDLSQPLAFNLGWKTMLIIAVLLWYINHRENAVYLIDFETFEPPEDWKVSPEMIVEMLKKKNCFSEESVAFQERMLKQSGCGPITAWPPGMVKSIRDPTIEADASIEASRKEAEAIMFTIVRDLLKKTKTKPSEIDILVVNCSLFSPTPSLCTMIINEFKLKPDVMSYNLSGMGCSAGLISIELVKNLLAAHPRSKALVVSTEIITPNLYHGNDKGFLLQNTLFRCGGAAILLSNKWMDAYRASFKLLHVFRTQYVSEGSYGCVYETEDELHNRGVRLSKDIVKVAGRAMERNFTTMGPHVLPISEQLKVVFWMVMRMASKKLTAMGINMPKVEAYLPDFKRGIDHFCIHAGGRGVIDGIEKNLNLTPRHVEASRYTLYNYGNTSSSSIWYEMDYNCSRMGMKRGERVLQVAFGSGFKCNTGVWLCLNNPRIQKKIKADTEKKNE